MGAVQQALLMVGGAGAVSTKHWNPADADAAVVLADGNKRMHRGSGSGIVGVRGHISHTTGKWYFELATTSDFVSGEASNVYALLANGSVGLSGQPIFSISTGIYWAIRGNTQYGTQAGFAGTTAGSGWAAANGVNWVGLACDLDAKTVEVIDNGVSRGTFSYTGTPGAMYPYGAAGTLSGAFLVLRVLASEFSGSIPSGYSAWTT